LSFRAHAIDTYSHIYLYLTSHYTQTKQDPSVGNSRAAISSAEVRGARASCRRRLWSSKQRANGCELAIDWHVGYVFYSDTRTKTLSETVVEL